MCELCVSDPSAKEAAVQYHKSVAHRLRALADNYDDLARGTIKPHTTEANVIAIRARGAIRELVEWI